MRRWLDTSGRNAGPGGNAEDRPADAEWQSSARRRAKPRRQAAERRGRWSEFLAAAWLLAKGYRILARRLRTRAGEIDLIARAPSGPLCFVEVKNRPGDAQAVLSVGPQQKQRIVRAAALYVARYPGAATKGVRFDIVAMAPGRWPVHVKDAFRPGS